MPHRTQCKWYRAITQIDRAILLHEFYVINYSQQLSHEHQPMPYTTM